MSLLLPIIALSACQADSGSSTNQSNASLTAPEPINNSITGTVSYRERMLLRPGVSLELALEDVSRADVATTVLASKSVSDPGQIPIAFELVYQPADINPAMSYALRARILDADGKLMFINDTHTPVLTRGAGSHADMMLVRVGENAAASEPAGMELVGMFRYMADAAVFRDCSTGKSFPVDMSEQYIELERAYLNSGIESGQELKVALRGRYLERPGMEENTRKVKLIVDDFQKISDSQECTPTHHADLVNTYWKLVEVAGVTVQPLAAQRQAHLVLHSAEQRVQGHGGCNTFFGSYKLSGEELSLSGLGSTMMACVDGMEIESSFMLALHEANRAEVSGQFLEIFNGEQKLARFEAVYF